MSAGATQRKILCFPQSSRLAVAALTIARFIRKGDFNALLFSGRSSVISRALFCSAWGVVASGYPKPKIFRFSSEGNICLYQNLPDGQHDRIARAQAFIDNSLPELNEFKNKRVCFVDEFVATGDKYFALNSVFGSLGFTSVTFAFYAAMRDIYGNAFVAEIDYELVRLLHEHTRDASGLRRFGAYLGATIKAIKNPDNQPSF